MTPKNPLETEPKAPYNPETINRFVAVLTAARMKPTKSLSSYHSDNRMIERQCLLIDADYRQNDSFEHDGYSIFFLAFCQSKNML